MLRRRKKKRQQSRWAALLSRLVRWVVKSVGVVVLVTAMGSGFALRQDRRNLVDASLALRESEALAASGDLEGARDKFYAANELREWALVSPGSKAALSGVAAAARLLRVVVGAPTDKEWRSIEDDLKSHAATLRRLTAA